MKVGGGAGGPAEIVLAQRVPDGAAIPLEPPVPQQGARQRRGHPGHAGERSQSTAQPIHLQHVRVVGIPGEGFIATFSGEQNLDLGARQLGDVVQGHGRRLMDQFFHVPEVGRQEVPKFLGGDAEIVVVRPEFFGRQPRIGAFVHHVAAAKPDGEGLDLTTGRFPGEAEDGGGIQSATEQNADRDIRDHVVANGGPDQPVQLLGRALKRTARAIPGKLQIPVAVLGDFSVLDDQGMTGWQLENAPQRGLLPRLVMVGEEPPDGPWVDVTRDGGIGEDRLDLRGEAERMRILMVVKRLDAHPIPRNKKTSFSSIPNRKGEHPPQPLHAGIPIFLIQVDDDFGVRPGPEGMAFREKFLPQFLEVIDFAVEDDPDRLIFIGHRLGTGVQVDDR